MCEDEIGMPLGLMMDPLKDPAMLSRDVKDMAYYLAQVEIRRILNRAHTVLYAEPNQKDHNSPWEKFDPRDLDWSLTRWRETLPHFLRWDDSDAPATDINAARLRAKYYGARYVINRPFLHYAVHTMAPQPIEFLAENDVPPPPHGDANGTAMETKRDNVFYSEHKIVHSKRLLRAAKASVEAAFRSTVAIDNVDGRPIVTNIWGTAHAYVS